MRIVKAAVLYFVLVFGAGFVLARPRHALRTSELRFGTVLAFPGGQIIPLLPMWRPPGLPGQPCPTVRLDERYVANGKNVNFMQSIFAFLLHL